MSDLSLSPTETAADVMRERVLLASILAAPGADLPPTLKEILRFAPAAFHDSNFGQIATAVRNSGKNGHVPDLLAIAEHLDSKLVPVLSQLAADAGNALPLDLAELEAAPFLKIIHATKITAVLGEAWTDSRDNPKDALAVAKNAIATLESVSAPLDDTSASLTIRTPDQILALPQSNSDNILGDRLLAQGQPMTLLGPGGIGKSRLALQLAAATRANRNFISLETHAPELRWLFLQTENGNRRFQYDLANLKLWLANDWPHVNDGLFIHTLETERDGWLSLESDANRKAMSDAIQHFEPDVVVFDPLNQICIGDPNKDVDMAATCSALTQLSRQGNPHRSIIALHHSLTGRAGAARAIGIERSSFGRNSKVLQAWTRGQINLAPISEDDNSTLAVACGKCSNGKEFPPFAIRLNPTSMIYELAPEIDMNQWRQDVSGTANNQPLMSPQRVAELCVVSGDTKNDLAKSIQNDCGCIRQNAYRYIKRAEQKHLISFDKRSNLYFRS